MSLPEHHDPRSVYQQRNSRARWLLWALIGALALGLGCDATPISLPGPAQNEPVDLPSYGNGGDLNDDDDCLNCGAAPFSERPGDDRNRACDAGPAADAGAAADAGVAADAGAEPDADAGVAEDCSVPDDSGSDGEPGDATPLLADD